MKKNNNNHFSDAELKVFQTSHLSSLPISNASLVVEDFECWTIVGLKSTVLDVGISSDQLTLSVTVERAGSIFANMYDVRAFATKVYFV